MEIQKYHLRTDRHRWVGARDACASKNYVLSTNKYCGMFGATCSMKFGISNYRSVIVLCKRTNHLASLQIVILMGQVATHVVATQQGTHSPIIYHIKPKNTKMPISLCPQKKLEFWLTLLEALERP